MRGLEVVATGVLAVVQDLGRPGHAGLGVAESGALDPGALRLANRLVGNPEHAAGVETTLGGLVLRAAGPTVLAVTGAPVTVTVTGTGTGTVTVTGARSRREYGAGSAVAVPDGAEVAIGAPPRGLRSWVAVRGGVHAPGLLGSASTDLLAGIGSPLAVGDRLAVGAEPGSPPPTLDQAPLATPADGPLVLRAVPGPRDDWFTAAAQRSLAGPWRVDPRSNRVGIRLDGPPLERAPDRRDQELPSEGAVAGAIQVATNGLPVLFLADHPVTGGYPVVACVVTGDLPLAAQAVPGQEIRFRTVGGPRLG